MVITFFGTGIIEVCVTIGACVCVDNTRRPRVDAGELLVYPKRDNFLSGVFYATNLCTIDLKSHVLVILFENLVGSLVHYLLSSYEDVINSNFLSGYCGIFVLLSCY